MTTMAMTGHTTECGGAQSIDELIAYMRPEVLAFCRRRVGANRAEEILSDVQLAALRAYQSGKQLSPGWIMTVARNKVIDHWRRVEREGRLVDKLKNECTFFTPDFCSGSGGEVAVTLGKLQPRYRSILVRHYVNGEPVGDIAEDDGVSYRAMESAMARARTAFRQCHLVA